MSENKIYKYSNGDLSVVWEPKLCIHAENCVQSLPKVYRPDERPWIKPDEATSDELIEQIETCPSGALSYIDHRKQNDKQTNKKTMEKGKVAGKMPMVLELEAGVNYAWCACGKSSNQPWCDGSHKGSGISPKVFQVEKTQKVALCMCKQTSNPAMCDGSHRNIIDE